MVWSEETEDWARVLRRPNDDELNGGQLEEYEISLTLQQLNHIQRTHELLPERMVEPD